jgi:hypothetical protein
MGHIGPHQLNCALCASCLPPRNCWSSLCLLPPVKLLQGSQLTQTRNDRHMDCAAVCVIVRFEYFEYFEYWFHHVPSCSICLKIVWKSFEITGTWSCHEALWLIHETLDSRLSPSSAVRQESQILPWLQVVARREKRRSGEGQVKKTANIKNMTTMWQHEAAMLWLHPLCSRMLKASPARAFQFNPLGWVLAMWRFRHLGECLMYSEPLR